ncbi:MAG: VOC family protein [Myxococcota bacterium]
MPTKIDYLMITVSDMARSVAFYRDALGIPLRFESPDWSEFDTDGTTLALHGGGVAGRHGTPGAAGLASLGFTVPDLDRTVAELEGRGVRFVVRPTDRPGEGIRLAVAADPDELELSFVESRR